MEWFKGVNWNTVVLIVIVLYYIIKETGVFKPSPISVGYRMTQVECDIGKLFTWRDDHVKEEAEHTRNRDKEISEIKVTLTEIKTSIAYIEKATRKRNGEYDESTGKSSNVSNN